MSVGGSQQPVVSTQQNTPWVGAQPALNQVMGAASGLYNSGTGYAPYTGETQAPLSPGLDMAINAGQNMAMGNLYGTPGTIAAQGLGQGMIGSQGLTPGIENALNTSTGLGQVVNQYGNVYSQASGNENPYLLASIAANDRRIADRVNSAMSGAGRYGSGAHTDVLGRTLAEAANPILAQDYAQRQATRLAALSGMGQGNQAMADILGQGLNRAGQWAQAMPALDAARYAEADRLAGYGDWLTNRAQQGLNQGISLYNTQQAWPWEQLSRYAAIAGGAGGLGGSRVTTAPSNAPPIGNRLLGGALTGGVLGSSFGPLGTGVGALGGGLLGLLQ